MLFSLFSRLGRGRGEKRVGVMRGPHNYHVTI